MEIQINEIDELKYIINKIFGVNVMKNSRQRDVVDSRLIYSKILRDRKYTLKSIGRSICKDHTTILHYLNQVDHFIKHDGILAEKYITCRNMFLHDKPSISEKLNEKDLLDIVEKISRENDILILERTNFLDIRDSFRRIEPIIKILEKRTPKGEEKLIEEKINKLFNALYEED